jgi:hypothetical protein
MKDLIGYGHLVPLGSIAITICCGGELLYLRKISF